MTLFPTFNENFSVVDDLDSPRRSLLFSEIQVMAAKENPDLRVALETAREADLDVTAARTAFLPTLTLDTDYGIEANKFALNSIQAACPDDPAEACRAAGPSAGPGLFRYGCPEHSGLGLGHFAEQTAPSGIQTRFNKSTTEPGPETEYQRALCRL